MAFATDQPVIIFAVLGIRTSNLPSLNGSYTESCLHLKLWKLMERRGRDALALESGVQVNNVAQQLRREEPAAVAVLASGRSQTSSRLSMASI